MKLIRNASLAALAVAMLTQPLGAQQTSTQPAPAAPGQPVPLEVWALRDVVNHVEVSPDGRHVLVLKTESREGDHILEIYATDDMTRPLRRLNSSPMEFVSARWVSDKHIYGTAWQVNRRRVTGQEGDVRDYKSYAYNLETNRFSESSGNFQIVNDLPAEPSHVLVATATTNDGGFGVDPFAAFRPRSYYRYNLDTGARELVLKGSDKFPQALFDLQGNPRFTTGYDTGSNSVINYYRMPGEGAWKEFGERYSQDDHKNLYRVLGGFMGLAGFDEEDPGVGYVIDNRGEDKAALWMVDFRTGQFLEKIYSNPNADVIGVLTSSMPDSNRIVAAIYPGAKMEMEWFDQEERALYTALERQIPNAHQIRITSRTRDGRSMVVYNDGPHDPGSFWLVRNGQMAKLGSRNPLLRPEQLADVEFIRYPARDGRMIPAYVTKPKGQGPFPLVVLPHGGPHVNEVISYDEWGQVLANNGYMVLQPQYRMSVGWGQSHFDSAYGQHGLAMQDDKDDGALYLAQQGLVDRNRMAMFGWSYGGYAALVAATRENNIYQCAIAGAAVADPEKSFRQGNRAYTPRAILDWAERRGTIGINPIHEVGKPSIPLLMVHGDVDSRVLYWHMTDYQKAVERAGVSNVQFLTLEGADHFYRTLMYNHQLSLYTKMLDFLKNDCGPGGL